MRVEIHPKKVGKYLAKLALESPEDAKHCAEALRKLGEDPYRSRPGVDIRAWTGQEFDYRLRVGRHRFGYGVRGDVVKVDDAWLK